MQSATWGVPTEGPVTPTVYSLRANDAFDSLLSLNSGDDPPAYAVKGTFWCDTSESPNPVYVYDGAVWCLFGLLDPTGHSFTFELPSIAIADVSGLQTALDGKVGTSRSVSASGLASGGGDLSANRTITVTKASQAQAEAGIDDATAMTPLKVAQAIVQQATPAAIGAVPTTSQASESAKGLIEIATDAEAIAGLDSSRAIVPSALAAVLAALSLGLAKIGPTAAVSGSSVSFTNLDAYRLVIAHLENVSPATSGSSLRCILSADNGSTYLNSNGDYEDVSAADDNDIICTGGITNTTEASGLVLFLGMKDADVRTLVIPLARGGFSAGVELWYRDNREKNNAIRFFWNSGNFRNAGGQITLYCL